MIELRSYQQEARDAVLTYWGNGGGNALVELPTGAGKSLLAAALMKELYEEHGAKIVLLTHVKELVDQDSKAVQAYWPEAPIGIYSAGLKQRNNKKPIVLASVQSVYRKPEILGHRDVVIIDEAHLLSRKDSGQYQRVLKVLKERQPHMRMVGLTATPYRTDSGLLTQGWRDTPPLFDEIVYRVSPLDLIKSQILSPILPYVSPERIDMTGVKITAGDYNQAQMQAACDKADINQRVANEIVSAGQDRNLWIVFAAGVDHAKHLRDRLIDMGIQTEAVFGDTPSDVRENIIRRAREGQGQARDLRCLVGANVLTTGLDLPAIDLIAMVRPTKSKGLFVQMLGRGLRRAPDKDNCLLLDFTSNTQTFGPIDMIDGSKGDKGAGKAPVKECMECHVIAHISATVCTNGHPFPVVEDIKYKAKSAGAAIFSDQSEPVWLDVTGIIVRRHLKEGSADSLRIDYRCGMQTISEYVTLEHETNSGRARQWWRMNSYSGNAPNSVGEALRRADDLRTPGRIQVFKNGKYLNVMHRDFSVPPGQVIPVQRVLQPSGYRRAVRAIEGYAR